jgi:alpha-D-xyloside xylohydrolase
MQTMAAKRTPRKVSYALLMLSTALLVPASAQQALEHRNVVVRIERQPDDLRIHLADGVLRIKPCTADQVRITFAPGDKVPDLSNPVLDDAACKTSPFSVAESDKTIVVATADLKISVNRASGAVQFLDRTGKSLLKETDWPFPRTVTPTTTAGLATNRAAVWFAVTPEERFYGLGQHQHGVLNQRNLEMELTQDNTNVSIPFYLSSKGYGVFWNNMSATTWNNRFQPTVTMRSSVADAVDYYFFYGPDFDHIISAYRDLTGPAPLFPRWAYGYWQSKLGYRSQKELLDVAGRYRALHIPLDAIILDAGYETKMSSRVFNSNFPSPRDMVEALHKEDIRLMVSVWPLFEPGSANYDDMAKNNYFLFGGENQIPEYVPGSRLYDALNPAARALYWHQIKQSYYDIGVDAFWMDSTEPLDMFGEEHGPVLSGVATALGNGARYANIYPLMTTKAVYDGQRDNGGNKRVFTLTRSAFAGQQRHAAAVWSGDTATNFETLKRQIPAGLNFAMTGQPYWTTDIGGFVGGDTSDPAYQEVFVRWFQYGTFSPIFRAHGTRANDQNELWSYGPTAQTILTSYDKLRYRLMPYIYSLAARTTEEGYTPMRALAFDFRTDTKVLDITDEFLFGPSLLIAPVTEAGAKTRTVYLPAGTDWFDFWTTKRVAGGQAVQRATPLSIMPIYVRAGTILPFGPEIEHTGQGRDKPVTLRIYPGADASFSLYDDDGETYGYEKGQKSWIAMQWNDKTRTLTLGDRQGSFPGMAEHKTFRVVIVKPGHEVGQTTTAAGHTVLYQGKRLQVHL